MKHATNDSASNDAGWIVVAQLERDTMKLNYAIQIMDGSLAEEGFETAKAALEFADSECGVTHRIVRRVEATGELLPQTDWVNRSTESKA